MSKEKEKVSDLHEGVFYSSLDELILSLEKLLANAIYNYKTKRSAYLSESNAKHKDWT